MNKEIERAILSIRVFELEALLRAYNADFISRKVIEERVRRMKREIGDEK